MIAFLVLLVIVLVFALAAVYLERKVSAFAQDRLGPMEVGPYGLGQTLADILKLLTKEDIVPAAANRVLFLLAPPLIFIAVFAGYAVLPVTSGLIGAGVQVGVFYLLAIISLDVLAILMAGWSSNSKFSLFGAMRSVAQIISYEVPVGLSILCVVVLAQSLDLQLISYQQGIWFNHYPGQEGEVNYLFGISALGIDVTQVGGFLTWNVVRMPLLFLVYIVFFIATLAECNRAPFDLPEAESELVGGYHTEYSGFRWAMVFLAEYGMMLLVSLLGAVLFWGGWNTPFPNIGSLKLAEWTSGAPGTFWGHATSIFWLMTKALGAVLLQMWVRWTYPRLRVDQLMYLCWKVLTPFMILMLFVCALWRLMMI
jgi:NADH-quinone oxidoreductase subunit H